MTQDREQIDYQETLRATVPSPRPLFSVVLPTFNEAPNLRRTLQLIQAVLQKQDWKYEIIVVDDNSPDGTGILADKIASEPCSRARVIHRKQARGLAASVLAGFHAAHGDVLAVLDADLQHPPEILPKLFAGVQEGTDVVVASRYAAGGTIPNWSLPRRLVSKCSTLLTRCVLPGAISRVQDPLSGCFAIRREVIEGVKTRPTGFRTLLEVLRAGRYDSIAEVPYAFAERTAGDSKLGVKIAVQDGIQLLRLAWRMRLEQFAKARPSIARYS